MVLLLVPLAGCSGDDDPEGEKGPKAVAADASVFGSFVGKVSGTTAFVAVVATPAEGGSGAVQIYLSDGKGLSELFSAPISDNSFTAKSEDKDVETEGELTADSVTGTVALPSGRTVEYEATPPTGSAGLYELTVTRSGELGGASAAGLGVTGQIALGNRGTGTLSLVDGKRLKLAVTGTRAGDVTHVRAGQVRLIVLSNGELRGVAKGRSSKGDPRGFFIRSA
ncbi:hypothetical protein [Nocardioides bizhenqiangii]|uniref:Lipoprotein n=1 Tax=Nocardioides bizhenqiangii TaxID=3095076 RepID=A0ABZ0ZVH7_9ACTN|nr:hypothetical protein [Nocardioides sp. HM61]WQQ28318.1 hypothetical protein SHK19_08825 [Nocardioides sp. HM61]